MVACVHVFATCACISAWVAGPSQMRQRYECENVCGGVWGGSSWRCARVVHAARLDRSSAFQSALADGLLEFLCRLMQFVMAAPAAYTWLQLHPGSLSGWPFGGFRLWLGRCNSGRNRNAGCPGRVSLLWQQAAGGIKPNV